MINSHTDYLYKVSSTPAALPIYFASYSEAKDWIQQQGSGVIKQRTYTEMTFPIERKIMTPCWVVLDESAEY